MAFGRQLHHACANFAQQPKQVRILHSSPCMCEFRTTNQACVNFAPAHASLVRNLLCSADSTLDLFFCIFFYVNSFLIPVISQSQALLCKDYKRGGNHVSKHMLCFTLSKIQGSLCFPFLSTIFFFLEAKQPLRMFSQRMRG